MAKRIPSVIVLILSILYSPLKVLLKLTEHKSCLTLSLSTNNPSCTSFIHNDLLLINRDRINPLSNLLLRFHPVFHPQLTNFIQVLDKFQNEHLKNKSKTSKKKSKTCFVVGSGPVGLLNALSAHRAGYETTILDKKMSRSREIYFDIASSAANVHSNFFPSLETLLSYGFSSFNTTSTGVTLTKISSSEQFLQLSCSALENFLSFQLKSLGVKFVEHEFNSTDPESLYMNGDLYIIAEGASSTFKRSQNIVDAVPKPLDLDLLPEIEILPLMHQSLMVKFNPSKDGNCPTQQRRSNNEIISPYKPGDVFDRDLNITSAYKRFFDHHCELQIFFKSSATTENVSASAAELIIQKVGKFLFTSEFDIQSFKFVTIEPKRASRITGVFSKMKKRFILVGDASINAHYR